MFRFAPLFVESTLAVIMTAKEGLQNAARRELRFLLEAVVKLSTRDAHPSTATFDERLSGLGSRSKRFEEYVVELGYFSEFETPDEANAEILSLYSKLSESVHAALPQLNHTIHRVQRGEDAGRESVATLNWFNKLAFQVFDIVLVRIFYGLSPSLAGDIFTQILDHEPKWRFHKGKFTSRLSRCFDYKAERRTRPRIE